MVAQAAARGAVRVNAGDRFIFVQAVQADERIARLPCAYFNAHFGCWQFPRSTAIGRRLTKALGDDLQWTANNSTDQLRTWLDRWDLAERMKAADELAEFPAAKEGLTSWRQQRRGFWFLYHRDCGLLDIDMGGGKSYTYLGLVAARQWRRNLVITTAAALEDWPKKHLPKSPIPIALVGFKESWDARRRAKAISEAIAAHDDDAEPLMVVLSWDMFWRPPLGPIVIKGRTVRPGLLAQCGFDSIFADEIQKAADPTGRRGRGLVGLQPYIANRIGSSGTIFKHKPENIFAPLRFIDPGTVGYSYRDFLERYCVFNIPTKDELQGEIDLARRAVARCPGDEDAAAALKAATDRMMKLSTVPRFVVGYKRVAELSQIFHAVTYHCEKNELELPEPIHQYYRHDISLAARRVYEEMRRNLWTVLDDGTPASAPNKLAMMIRLQQIACGFIGGLDVADDDAPAERVIDASKATVCGEILQDIDDAEKVLIVYKYKPDAEAIAKICREQKRPIFVQRGGKHQLADFVEYRGERGAVLIAQQSSIAEAVDLSSIGYAILYSLGWSLDQFDQLIKRLDRPGQKRRPVFAHCIARGTIEETIEQARDGRRDVIKAVISAERKVRDMQAAQRAAEDPSLFDVIG